MAAFPRDTLERPVSTPHFSGRGFILSKESSMGLFDRFGGAGVQRPVSQPAEPSADDIAIARYRYLLRTAPPETIEQAHAEAFAQLTPEQRRRVLQELCNELPEAERAAAARAGDSPEQLARVATRAEIRQPGVLERTFGGLGATPGAAGFGSLFASSLLGSVAGTVLGSMIAQHFFSEHADAGHFFGDAADHASTQTFDDGGDIISGFDGGDTFDI